MKTRLFEAIFLVRDELLAVCGFVGGYILGRPKRARKSVTGQTLTPAELMRQYPCPHSTPGIPEMTCGKCSVCQTRNIARTLYLDPAYRNDK